MNTFPKTHVSYSVSDIEKTAAFYSLLFNTKPETQKSDYLKYNVAQPALSISFIKNAAGVQTNGSHFGIQFETTEEVTQHLERLKSAGLPMDEEMGVGCCYSVQDKFWVTDPDGYRWEVYYKHDEKQYESIENNQEVKMAACSGTEGCC